MHSPRTLLAVIGLLASPIPELAADAGLTLDRDDHWLIIRGAKIPGDEIRINYLEAYCRANSTDADWRTQTVIRHTTDQVSLSPDRKTFRLRDTLTDGLI